MAVLDLRVLVVSVPAGTVHQDEHGLMTFVYDEGYQGPPLSLSMPISNRSYGPDVLRPYLFGLLPDSELQRRAIGRELGVSANNPVTLLAHIGLDCPGAVQLCAPERVDEALSREYDLRELTDHEIALRLKTVRDEPEVSWMGLEERWSLGGNQGSLRWQGRVVAGTSVVAPHPPRTSSRTGSLASGFRRSTSTCACARPSAAAWPRLTWTIASSRTSPRSSWSATTA